MVDHFGLLVHLSHHRWRNSGSGHTGTSTDLQLCLFSHHMNNVLNEPQHEKTNKMTERSLIRVFARCSVGSKGPSFLHADSED